VQLASLAREKIAGYENSVQTYADSSKNLEGTVGIGCYVEATSRTGEIKHCARVADKSA
jgi:hypothetical protein